MAYNTTNFEIKESIAPDTKAKGVIIDIKDGKVSDFVEDTSKFGNPDQTVINVTAECMYNEQKYTDSKMFSYTEVDGKMQVPAKSNLGKYYKYYEKMAEIGDIVDMKTNKEGYFKIMFE